MNDMNDLRWYIDKAGKSTLQYRYIDRAVETIWQDVPVVSDFVIPDNYGFTGIESQIKNTKKFVEQLKNSNLPDDLKFKYAIQDDYGATAWFYSGSEDAEYSFYNKDGEAYDARKTKDKEDPELYPNDDPHGFNKCLKENPEIYENYLECDNTATVNILCEDSINSSIELVAFIETGVNGIKVDTESVWLSIKDDKYELDEHWDAVPWVNDFLYKINKWYGKHHPSKTTAKIKQLLDSVGIDEQGKNERLTNYIVEHIEDFVSIYNDGIKCGFFLPKKEKSELQD